MGLLLPLLETPGAETGQSLQPLEGARGGGQQGRRAAGPQGPQGPQGRRGRRGRRAVAEAQSTRCSRMRLGLLGGTAFDQEARTSGRLSLRSAFPPLLLLND